MAKLKICFYTQNHSRSSQASKQLFTTQCSQDIEKNGYILSVWRLGGLSAANKAAALGGEAIVTERDSYYSQNH
ncbi:MAG: hypothetical protein ACJAUL_002132 [Paraglaciecola sp.]|jgi:hypothetical protein